MEFSSRGNPQPVSAASHKAKRPHIDWNGKVVRIEWFIFTLLVAAVLLVTIGWSIFAGGWSNPEFNKVNQSKYQAIFLNGGSTSGSVDYTTYFGHISKINEKYFVLKDIYYLTTATSEDGKTVTPQLTKLGCQQLHAPYDQMVINRNQVAFWENMADTGKVTLAIKDYIKANPNGPDCSAATSSSSTTQPTTTTQPSTTAKP